MSLRAKRLIGTIIFLTILASALWGLQRELIPFKPQDTNQHDTFYKLEKNSVDVIAVGSSSVMVGFSPLRLYENTGITSFVRCSSLQAPAITYLNVKEALKTQSPKLVIISAYTLLLKYKYDRYEAWVRRGMDYKKLSADKIYVANEICKRSEWQTTASYIFPILRYHLRWQTVIRGNNDHSEWGAYDYMHGQYPVYKNESIKDVAVEKMADTTKEPIREENFYWYDKIVKLCAENDIKVLFLVTPDMRWTMGKHEAIKEAADDWNVEFLDFNVDGITAKSGLKWDRDFYDDHHVNANGSIMLTDYVSKYIEETYELEESRVLKQVKKQFKEDMAKFEKDRRSQ